MILSNFESLSEEDISKYAGEWIAIVDNKIVSHGKSFRDVFAEAKKNYPGKRPLFGKLPENSLTVLSIS